MYEVLYTIEVKHEHGAKDVQRFGRNEATMLHWTSNVSTHEQENWL